METQQTTTTTQVSMKRKAATKLWVYFQDIDSEQTALISFDFKSELDIWLAGSNVRIMEIIRGSRKEWTAQTRVTLT
jgi:hypothetical protein